MFSKVKVQGHLFWERPNRNGDDEREHRRPLKSDL